MSSLGDRAYQGVLSIGLPITGELVDNTVLGSGFVCLARGVSTGGSSFAIKLGRQPSGYIVIDCQVEGTLYSQASDRAQWGPSSITIRSSEYGAYSFIVI